MQGLKIAIVDIEDDVAHLKVNRGDPSLFRTFNDICNELIIRFVPALRVRAAPTWSLAVLGERLEQRGIKFKVPPELCERSHVTRPCVLVRLRDGYIQFFLGGGRCDSALFADYRRVFFEAKIPYDKSWAAYVAPFSGQSVAAISAKLGDLGFIVDVGEEVFCAIEAERNQHQEASQAIEDAIASLNERGFSLYPYQLDGVRWLAKRRHALLADEMGLGKTAQALLALRKEAPTLVVCPAVAKGIWRIEAKTWRPGLSTEVLSGRGSFRWPQPGELVAVNYELLPDKAPAAPPEGLVLIADEAHALKNQDAKRTVRFGKLADAVAQGHGSIWLLSGTPLLNQPKELWTVLSQARLHTTAFGSWSRFRDLFGGEYIEVSKGVWTVQWGEPSSEVRNCLAKVMLRRKRDDVLSDLPPKRYETVLVDSISTGTCRACDAAEDALAKLGVSLEAEDDELLAALHRRKVNAVLGKVSSARKALSREKGRLAIDIVKEHEAQEMPLVVFSAFRPVIDELGQRDGWAAITGSSSSGERAEIQEAFQRGELLGVAATIRAGGTALTLTRASRALFVDLDWTPGLNVQAEDRLCRIGQRSSVLITRLVADVSLDRRVSAALARKGKLLEATGLAASDVVHDASM